MPNGLFTLKQQAQAVTQGAWTGYIPPAYLEYLVVGGGGNGGDLVGGAGAGGGGAGGLLQGSIPVASATSYTVTIGAGSPRFGTGTGGSSAFGSISVTGGGAGARSGNNAGSAGGSGGGASGSDYPNGYNLSLIHI